MTEITMPRLSDSMEEGTIVRWLVEDGGAVARGQELVEIETDKATITHAAEADGLLEILAAEGTTLAVGEPIARVGAVGGGRANANVASDGAASELAPLAETVSIGDGRAAGSNGHGEAPALAPEPVGVSGGVNSPTDALATPLARRVARVHAVELGAVAGTGPRGRITQADVLMAAGVGVMQPRRAVTPVTPVSRPVPASDAPSATVPAPAAPGAARPAVTGAKGETTRVEASRLQQLVARRMAESKATIPHFQVQTEVTMDAAIALRSGLKASANGEAVPSLNDFVVKACAIALRQHPRANGSYADGGFELHRRINIGVAVAGDDALVVPVVPDADTKSLGAIARETRRMAARVRSGEISPPELSGGTFTVSNLGMFGMTAITPVINPPQAAILGVGALRETLARVDGEIVDRTLMTLTLSCDHRILYGADAARLLADVRTLLETPLGLAL
jgi:pyruvate dehydrogenase E2 component (dihydrolipoamide acetyltransferase)